MIKPVLILVPALAAFSACAPRNFNEEGGSTAASTSAASPASFLQCGAKKWVVWTKKTSGETDQVHIKEAPNGTVWALDADSGEMTGEPGTKQRFTFHGTDKNGKEVYFVLTDRTKGDFLVYFKGKSEPFYTASGCAVQNLGILEKWVGRFNAQGGAVASTAPVASASFLTCSSKKWVVWTKKTSGETDQVHIREAPNGPVWALDADSGMMTGEPGSKQRFKFDGTGQDSTEVYFELTDKTKGDFFVFKKGASEAFYTLRGCTVQNLGILEKWVGKFR